MTVGERIRARRKEIGVTADQLADILGVSRSTVFRYENGYIEKLPISILEPIAEALHTTPEYLMGWTDDPINYDDGNVVASIPLSYMELFNGDAKKAYSFIKAADADAQKEGPVSPISNFSDIQPCDSIGRRIPIYGYVAAGIPIFADEHIEGFDYADVHNPNEYFYLRVKGDSMVNANIFDGDLVLVHKTNIAANGQIVVCLVNGDEATLKRFYQQGDVVVLQPENPAYTPIIVPQVQFDTGYARILGVAKEVKRKL